MLVLTRKDGEQIILSNGVRITVCRISSDHVRIGIDAPDDVDVHRKEVWDEIKRQREWEGGVDDF